MPGLSSAHPVARQLVTLLGPLRASLARSLAHVNQLDHTATLALAHRLLARLVFVRTLDDRKIAPTYDALATSRDPWAAFLALSQPLKVSAPAHEHDLAVDRSVFAEIVAALSPSRAEFRLDTAPPTLLGDIHEQFLARAPPDTTPAPARNSIRKTGGIHYTPGFIVRHIVEHTVGPSVIGREPAEISKMAFADIACGAGNFLVELLACLLRHHLAWYLHHDPRSWEAKGVLRRREPTGDYVLAFPEKCRILLACVYGVDLDPQAVELTQLTLYLHLLADERFPSTQALPTLPDLHKNILCGNSLVEPDTPERLDLRPLDLRAHLPRVFAHGGFTAIVGNPPYVRPHNIPVPTKQYLWRRYSTFVAKSDLYACFIERALDLVAPDGRVAYIVPHTWTSLESFAKLRRFILDHARIERLVQLPQRVFAGAAVETCILGVARRDDSAVNDRSTYELWRLDATRADKLGEAKQGDLRTAHLCNFQLYRDPCHTGFFERIAAGKPKLGDLVTFAYGFKTADDARFIHPEPRYPASKPFVPSAHIGRYHITPPIEYVWYDPETMRKNRQTARPGDTARFESEKLLVARMGKQLVAAYDPGGLYVKDAIMLLPRERGPDLKTILAVLNSRLLNYLYKTFFVTIDVLKNALLSLPIPDLADPRHATARTSLSKLAERILHAKSAESRNPCEAIEREIDAIVYALYGITQDEIALIEASPPARS